MGSESGNDCEQDETQLEVERLRAKVAELQGIIDAIPVYMFYKNDRNTILDLNATAAASIGLPPDKIRGKQTEAFFPPADSANFLEDDRRVIASGKPKLGIVECYETGEAGQRRHIRTDKIPLRGPSGEFDRLVAIATDTTDAVRALDRANYAEQRLSLAMKAGKIGLWDWNIRTGETYFSDTFFTMHGYEVGEFASHVSSWENMCNPDDLEVAYDGVARHIRGETPLYVNEQRILQKNGDWRWVRAVGEVVERDESGEPVRMLGVHVDIQEIREALERAESASKAKSDFLANMSHEIRTPMTAILGYSDLMVNNDLIASDADELAEMAKSIHSNANHLLDVINDILDVSKIEAGFLSIEQIETSPLCQIEEVASLLRPRAQSKGIELRVIYDTSVPSVIVTDPTRVKQILFNLVGNAIKFTEIGTVTIRFRHLPDEQMMAIDVIDTGIGIRPEQVRVLQEFEPFMQADASTTRKFGGTGLGLHISRSLSAMLGGGIEIESEFGRGTTVRVRLRARVSPEAEFIDAATSGLVLNQIKSHQKPDGARRSSAKVLAGTRILLAEDGPDNQRLISFNLQSAGAEVTVAKTGVEAIELARQLKPHLILMDMQMPEMDGYEATRKLRENGCGLPIIALTAHAMDGDRKRCIDAGCSEYLTKPIDKYLLIQTCVELAEASARITG